MLNNYSFFNLYNQLDYLLAHIQVHYTSSHILISFYAIISIKNILFPDFRYV